MDSKRILPSSSREMRNIAEKMRRDKMNNFVSELASIVPLVCGSNKRIDKTSVLRLAANFIRMHNILGEVKEQKRVPTPGVPVQRRFMASLEEAIGGFLLVISSTGKVVFITEAVESFFGYSQVDLLGNSIYNVIHSEDHEILKNQLESREEKEDGRRSFFCRMMEKALSRNDPSHYEIIHIVGILKTLPHTTPATPAPTISKSTTEPADSISSDSDSDDDTQSVRSTNKIGTHMLIGFIRVVKDRPITEISLVESTQDEYITRHTMDGKILYSDHRISFVTGLMPTEVFGTSAFKYMHSDDMVWSMVAHKLMFSSSQGQGLVSYRLKCKGGSLVTLRSRGYIELNKETGQAETFVCINTVVSNKEAKDEIRNQRRKLLPIIASRQSEDHLFSVPSSMPPEMLSMIEQLMDPMTLQRMIAEVDPTMNSSSPLRHRFPKKSRIKKDASLEFNKKSRSPKKKHEDCSYSKHSDPDTMDFYHKVREKTKSNIQQKRNSHEEVCTLPSKKYNHPSTSKTKADVYHQSYSPQDPLPLPQLSPESVQPFLCSPETFSGEKLNNHAHNKNIEFHNRDTTKNHQFTSSTSNMNFPCHATSQRNASKFHQETSSENCDHFSESYHNCRLCGKNNDSKISPLTYDQGFDVQNACTPSTVVQSITSTQPKNTYQYQGISQSINASNHPSSFSGQVQMNAKYVAPVSDIDQKNRSLQVSVPHHSSCPHEYTNSYPEQSCCSSIPEFDIKLQRQLHEGQFYPQCYNLEEKYQNISHQKLDYHENWLSKSAVSHTLAMSTNPVATNMQQLCNIPNQCMTSSVDNQGASVPVMYRKNCSSALWNTQ